VKPRRQGTLVSLASFLVLGALVLGACARSPQATPVPRPQAPQVKLAAVATRFVGTESALVQVDLEVTNPNNFLVTVDSLSVETFLEDYSPTLPVAGSPVSTFYIPGGKTVTVSTPVQFTSGGMTTIFIGTKGMAAKDAAAAAGTIFAAVKAGTAKWRVEAVVQASSPGGTISTPYSLRP